MSVARRIGRVKLVGWLVILRHNLSDSRVNRFHIPHAVKDALCECGWIEYEEPDEDGVEVVRITEEGTLVSDLDAPEWGIDPLA